MEARATMESANRRGVRISVPASVAADLGAFQKSIGLIVEQLGCSSCCSGVDISLVLERNFVINEKLEINPGGNVALPTDPVPWRPVTVTLAKGVSYDLGKIQEAVAMVASRLGCSQCCSGFDITLRQQLEPDFMVDEHLNVRTFSEIR